MIFDWNLGPRTIEARENMYIVSIPRWVKLYVCVWAGVEVVFHIWARVRSVPNLDFATIEAGLRF